MSISTIISLVLNQLRRKWGRTLLSSMGIMIGVWAILLTVSLSQGLSDKLLVAVNSQSIVRTVQYYQTDPAASSFFDLNADSQWVNLPYSDLFIAAGLIGEEKVDSINPSDTMSMYLHRPDSNPQCVNDNVDAIIESEGSEDEIVLDNCYDFSVILQPFGLILAENDDNWYGDKSEPDSDEIVVCFVCNQDNPLHEFFDAEEPDDLVGKEITLEYSSTPTIADAGTTTSLVQSFGFTQPMKQSVPRSFTISAVFDDRESTASLLGIINSFGYASYDVYTQAIEQQLPEQDISALGYIENNIFLDSFDDLDSAVEALLDEDYLVFSTGQFLSSSITTVFLVISVVLGIFAGIALIAALFGIINVMTISVLERQKEIGILKSLGTNNIAIFWIFILESLLIGLLGWILGVILTWFSSFVLSTAFDAVLLSNESVKENLETLNITSFALTNENYMLLATLVLAVVFTVLSGLVPSINAARENPVEVLRTE